MQGKFEQQNDHCIIRFNGEDWRIVGMLGLGMIVVQNKLFPKIVSTLDLSAVNWPSYIEAAVAGLNDEWWWLDLEDMAKEVVDVCGLSIGSRGTIYAALRDAHRMGADDISYDELKRRQAAEREQWAREHPEDDMVI